MSKKVGPFPLWAWLVVAAVGGYIIYRVRSAQSEEGSEVEGYYPAERAEPNEGGSASGTGGIAQLGEEIGQLREAGFVPSGSEESRGEPPITVEREAAPEVTELLKGQIASLQKANKALRARVRGGKAGKRGAGKGAAGKRGAANKGKRAPSNPRRHTHQPSHTPSRHPAARHRSVAKAQPAKRNQRQRARR